MGLELSRLRNGWCDDDSDALSPNSTQCHRLVEPPLRGNVLPLPLFFADNSQVNAYSHNGTIHLAGSETQVATCPAAPSGSLLSARLFGASIRSPERISATRSKASGWSGSKSRWIVMGNPVVKYR